MITNEQLEDILKFKDEGIPEDQFEIFLASALERGKQFDFSQWLRDKPTAFYLGMISAVHLYKIIHQRFGLVLQGPDGLPFDDQLGQELSLVIKSII